MTAANAPADGFAGWNPGYPRDGKAEAGLPQEKALH